MSRLKPTDADYKKVLDMFGKTMAPEWVTDVFRVHNFVLEVAFDACKARMLKESKRSVQDSANAERAVNEQLLFHATTRAASGGIIREGFDLRRAGTAFGTAYGPGAYFSPKAMFSHGYSKEDSSSKRCMLVCRVLLGRPVPRNAARVPDSVVDNAADPSQYVVNRECQILPAYALYYEQKY